VEKRLVLFLILSTAIMVGWLVINQKLAPQRPVVKQDDAQKAKDKKPPKGDKGKDGDAVKGRPDKAPIDKPDGGDKTVEGKKVEPDQPAEVPAAKPVDREWISLGSVDPASPYRMLVTLTNYGGTVERIELSSERYRDLEDTSGYLGHLAPTPSRQPAGCKINAVGAGTPAARAVPKTSGVKPGLRPGDVIRKIDGTAIGGPAALESFLNDTKPGREIELTVSRQIGGKMSSISLTATVVRRPMEVIRPELPDPRDKRGRVDPAKLAQPRVPHPLSFLMTLQQIGHGENASATARGETEIDGLPSLRTRNWEVVRDPKTPDEVAFRMVIGRESLAKIGQSGPIEIIKRFRLAHVPKDAQDNLNYRAYHLTYELEIHNHSDQPQTVAYRQDGPTGLPIEGWWYAYKTHPKWFTAMGSRDVIFQLTSGGHNKLNMLGCASIVKQARKHPENPTKSLYVKDNMAPLKYAGVDAQYFSAVMIPADADEASYTFSTGVAMVAAEIDSVRDKKTDVTFRLDSQPQAIEPGGSLKQRFDIFAGPKAPDLLSEYKLKGTIVYGWFAWVAIAMIQILDFFYRIVGNYGLAIILLTVLVRACMFPLSRKQVLSAQKMQELQPEIKKITEKYKNDMEKRGKAQQELFKKHNYNPLGGCLLLFLQLPIFIGLYKSLSIHIALRQAPLIPGIHWCSNLAAPEQLWMWKDVLPAFLAGPNGWLGPYLNILPLFTVALFIVQQKLFAPPATDDQQKMQQQMMTFMMLFIGVMFFKVASGLCIYFIASSLWGVAERKLLPKVQKPAEDQATYTPKHTAADDAAKKRRTKKRKRR